MSPPPSRDLKGLRPARLKIHKDSRQIHKPTSSSPGSTSSSSSSVAAATAAQRHHRHHPLPVIIYTDSPKVIITQASDFMALVQKLTGYSSSNSEDEDLTPPPPPPIAPSQHITPVASCGSQDESACSSESAFDPSYDTVSMIAPATFTYPETPTFYGNYVVDVSAGGEMVAPLSVMDVMHPFSEF